jgi:hypothetical protein
MFYIFVTVSALAAVMQVKNVRKEQRKIFFDHQMTPVIRELFLTTHRVAKKHGEHAFLYGGRVLFELGTNKKHQIRTTEDLSKISTALAQ